MKRHWTKEDIEFLDENNRKLPLEEICQKLNRSEMSVKLFLHRRRYNPKGMIEDNILLRIIRHKFNDPTLFSPNRQFYLTVGIGQRRYWQIYKGIATMTDEECKRVCSFFKVDYNEYLNIVQKELF